MATPDIAPFNKYIGNGATTQFSVGFPYINADFIHVYIKRTDSDQEEVDTTDWEWVNETTIRFPATGSSEAVLGNGEVLVVQRETPTENEFTFANQKRLFPEDVMKADDLDMQILQEQARELGRAVKVEPTSSVDPEELVNEVERMYQSIDNIDTVANDITNVNAVATDLTNIDNVAADLTNIDSVAADLTNIDAVAGNETNINAVNANKTNIDKVAGDINRVNLVADDISSVHTVAVDISNVIDVANNKTNIDTVAGDKSNVDAVAENISDVNDCVTNMQAIIDAPTYAALAEDWATKTDATVDGSEYSAKYYAETAAATLANKIDRHYAIEDIATNCITEIPQDINLTLSSGTLTLKSGSVITNPNGTQLTTTEDKTLTISSSGTYVVALDTSGATIKYQYLNACVSGTTDSKAGTPYHWWFDTTNNVINRYADDASTPTHTLCFPFAIVTVSGGAISSIDTIFNGAGYIGHTFFVLPGITGLAPNGRASDGSYNAIEITEPSLHIYTVSTTSHTNIVMVVASAGGIGAGAYHRQETIADAGRTYIPSQNRVYQANGTEQPSFPILSYDNEGETITRFEMFTVSGLDKHNIENALGYTAENASNKVTSVSSGSTDAQYPTAKALYDIKTGLESSIATKQDAIADLTTIRSGAAAGATAIQASDLGTAAYTDSTDYATATQGGKADTSVQPSDLSAGLDTKIDKYHAVNDILTNGISYIPQDIKLTLSSGTLTLKSGSVVTFPDGTQYQETSDKSATITYNDKYLVCVTSVGNILTRQLSNCVSGAGATTTSGFAYNTTTNQVRWFNSAGEDGGYTCSFPICIVTVSGGAISSIDQVFNGFGYIGNCSFMLPGVSVLVANGYNSDGTLKSITHTNNSLLIRNNGGVAVSGFIFFKDGTVFNSDTTSHFFFQNETPTLTQNRYEYWWCPKDNMCYWHTNTQTEWYEGDWVVVCDFVKSTTTFTEFDIRPVSILGGTAFDTAIGYTPENSANKVTSLSSSSTDTQYPSAKLLYDTKTALESSLNEKKIDKGYAVNDFATNCITEIPQDVKVELASDGTLTVKSGTKLYVPNGSDVDVYELAADTTKTQTSNGKYVVCFNKNTIPWSGTPSLVLLYENKLVSGATDSLAGTTYHGWYDTTNNVIKRYADNTSTPAAYCCYPLCTITVSGGKISSIDKVFNGAGYCGHHAFVLPDVKGLEPGGKNTDGSLKTYLYKNTSLVVIEMAASVRVIGTNQGNGAIGWSYYHETDDINTYEWTYPGDRVYDKSTNILYALNASTIRHLTPIVFCSYNGTSVTEFDIRPVSGLSGNYISNALTSITGYDATKTQTLKHISGVLTWVTDT